MVVGFSLLKLELNEFRQVSNNNVDAFRHLVDYGDCLPEILILNFDPFC